MIVEDQTSVDVKLKQHQSQSECTTRTQKVEEAGNKKEFFLYLKSEHERQVTLFEVFLRGKKQVNEFVWIRVYLDDLFEIFTVALFVM